jgi:hypothetical protein
MSRCALVAIPLLTLALAAAVWVWPRGGSLEANATTSPALPGSQIDAVAELGRGVSPDHLRALLGRDSRHQFTSRVGANEYLCVSHAFGAPHARLYFVFKDGKLEKITEPPASPTRTVPYQGASLEQRLPVDPEARIAEVMLAPDISGQPLRAALAARLPRRGNSSTVLPAFRANAAPFAASEPRRRREYLMNERLAKHFDARKVRLGESREQVDGALGQPLQTARAGGRTVCVYGSTEPLPMVAPAELFSPIDVHFESGRAVAVFGNDFVNTVEGVTPKQ